MLYLASQSPRRRQLLEQLGYEFSVLNIAVPERRSVGESAFAYVSRVARDKALAGWRVMANDPVAAVIGSDTEVVLDDSVFGKPQDQAAASAMLGRLSGRVHEVISVVWLINAAGEHSEQCISRVRFGTLDQAAIDAYVATGESYGKAGAYAIQGRGAVLVEHLEGSYSGVMGLPLFETHCLLQRFR